VCFPFDCMCLFSLWLWAHFFPQSRASLLMSNRVWKAGSKCSCWTLNNILCLLFIASILVCF
jgi:hypothetical protein